MKVNNSEFVIIKELENEFGRTNEICLSFSEENNFSDKSRIFNKSDLHKFIGALLHVQSKMK